MIAYNNLTKRQIEYDNVTNYKTLMIFKLHNYHIHLAYIQKISYEIHYNLST